MPFSFFDSRKSTVYSLLHQFVTAGFGFLIIILFYRYAGEAETGKWIVLGSALSLCEMLMHGLLQINVIRELASEKGDKNRIASNAAIMALCLWLVLSSVILILHWIFRSDFTSLLLWYIPGGLSMILYNVCWWIGSGKGEFKKVFIQRSIYSFIALVFVLSGFALNGKISIVNVILSQLAAYTITSLFAIFNLYHLTFSLRFISRSLIKSFISYGRYTSLSMLMGSLLRNADVFMISYFMGNSAVAIYGAAQKVLEIFETFLRGFASKVFTEFCSYRNDFRKLKSQYLSKIIKLCLFFLLPSLLIFIFPQTVIKLISGSSAMEGSYPVLKVFMIYVFFLVADRMTGILLESSGMAHFNLGKMLVLAIVNIYGNYIALKVYGSLTYVAAVSILATSVGILTGIFLFNNRSKKSDQIRQLV